MRPVVEHLNPQPGGFGIDKAFPDFAWERALSVKKILKRSPPFDLRPAFQDRIDPLQRRFVADLVLLELLHDLANRLSERIHLIALIGASNDVRLIPGRKIKHLISGFEPQERTRPAPAHSGWKIIVLEEAPQNRSRSRKSRSSWKDLRNTAFDSSPPSFQNAAWGKEVGKRR